MGHSLGSSSSDGPSTSSIKDSCRMVKTFQAYLPECCHRTYSCVHCRAHLANHDELISKVSTLTAIYLIDFHAVTCCHFFSPSLSREVKDALIFSIQCKFSFSLTLHGIFLLFGSSIVSLQFFLVVVHRVNVGCGPAEERVLLTGLHAVADIYCESCKTTLGWKYVKKKISHFIDIK